MKTKGKKIDRVREEFEKRFVLTEDIWEGNENLMFLGGEPLGMTIRSDGKEIDRWWPDLKNELWSFLHQALSAQEERLIGEIREKIGERKGMLLKEPKNETDLVSYAQGYDKAIEDILSLLDSSAKGKKEQGK